ncbi:MAG: energy transducer TonB [Sulfurisoma sp.]|nr:energy transducer TonB [Sulfurisoma sp.]
MKPRDTAPAIVLGKLAGDDRPVETVPAATATKATGQDALPSAPSGNTVTSEPAGYLPPERLTHQPEIRDMGNLDLPGIVRPGDNGRLVLEILISDEGRPDAIRVIETSVPAPFLSNAIRVFQWARYEPGRELNRAVRSRIRVEIVLGAQPSYPDSTVLPRGGTNHRLERLFIPPH